MKVRVFICLGAVDAGIAPDLFTIHHAPPWSTQQRLGILDRPRHAGNAASSLDCIEPLLLL